jgi:hypothetical protein
MITSRVSDSVMVSAASVRRPRMARSRRRYSGQDEMTTAAANRIAARKGCRTYRQPSVSRMTAA